jgi:ribose 5-phosphate isomerase A
MQNHKLTKRQIENVKKAAALAACEMIEPDSVIGLGSGSTMMHLAEEIGRRNKNGHNISVVPTSYEMMLMAKMYNIPLLIINNVTSLPLAIDGADEIDPEGNAIKGKGGAQTCEKIVASLAEQYVLIADQTKLVDRLGKNMPVPVEVLPAAMGLVRRRLESFDCEVTIRLGTGKVGPVITDYGNMILDLRFAGIDDCMMLDRRLNDIPGVVGHGLFTGIVDKAIAGFIENGKTKTKILKFKPTK